MSNKRKKSNNSCETERKMSKRGNRWCLKMVEGEDDEGGEMKQITSPQCVG